MPAGRPKKKPRKQPSIIDSELDHRFSANESDEYSTDAPSDNSATPMSPPPVPQKCREPAGAPPPPAPVPTKTANPTAMLITYAIAVFSCSEMKKPISKRTVKNSSLQLNTTDLWDTFQQQLRAKIEHLLKPTHNTACLNDYDVMFTIPRILAKPGLSLASNIDYDILLARLGKSTLVHIVVASVIISSDKENDGVAPQTSSKQKKVRDPATLLGNVNRTANIRALQARWKCVQKQPFCMGMYCLVATDSLHVPLSNEALECWASAMVN